VPAFLDDRFEGLDEKPEERAEVAADVAAEQIEDLIRRGIREFHLYTMNRAPLIGAVLERLGFRRDTDIQAAGAAA
jgi:methylenetetrahydrofolate reductase (NADPH)